MLAGRPDPDAESSWNDRLESVFLGAQTERGWVGGSLSVRSAGDLVVSPVGQQSTSTDGDGMEGRWCHAARCDFVGPVESWWKSDGRLIKRRCDNVGLALDLGLGRIKADRTRLKRWKERVRAERERKEGFRDPQKKREGERVSRVLSACSLPVAGLAGRQVEL